MHHFPNPARHQTRGQLTCSSQILQMTCSILLGDCRLIACFMARGDLLQLSGLLAPPSAAARIARLVASSRRPFGVTVCALSSDGESAPSCIKRDVGWGLVRSSKLQ